MKSKKEKVENALAIMELVYKSEFKTKNIEKIIKILEDEIGLSKCIKEQKIDREDIFL